uniref:Uncharacterized protein n=1 Tax=Entomoneis paludosa TaxID=265537 RepID=A0A7S3DXF9_9STRA|mmetsp:Transcript_5972/g.12576  ORF Transcript_5972/g.12576 Transcript_5972/m.12576 type:complete len:912 (+) Transcript_5972:47-2782(+)
MSALTAGFSYDDILQYLEQEFLPAVTNNSGSETVAATPLRQKTVGAATLTGLGKRRANETGGSTLAMVDENRDDIEKVLEELSSNVVPKLETMLLQPGGKVDINANSGGALLRALNDGMGSVLALTSSRQAKLSSLQAMLALTNRVVADMAETTLGEPAGEAMTLRLELALTICKVFRHLEKIPSTRNATEIQLDMYSNCFRWCLGYFCNMIRTPWLNSGLSSPRGNINLLQELYNVFEDYRLVGSIIYQSRPDGRKRNISPQDSSSVLDFFSLLASCGHAGLVSFLTDPEIAPMLNEILRAASNTGVPNQPDNFPPTMAGATNDASGTSDDSPFPQIRGYKPNSSGIGFMTGVAPRLSWEVDPKHENCIRVYRFLAVSVRAATETYSSSPKDKAVKKKFFDRALYCLNSNERSIEECLLQVSRATLVDTMGRPLRGREGHLGTQGLTAQVLREASAIFALLTEVCDGNEDIFYQHYGKLYDKLIAGARQVVLSTCCFLGAAGMSRELFQTMSDLEKGNGGSNDDSSTRRIGFSPVIGVFTSSGRSNTRHEAIQFSHFVSACSATVSDEERKVQMEFPPSSEQNTNESGTLTVGSRLEPKERTESSLEQNSRSAITSNFEISLEMEAGLCLFHAASMLWSTHPATMSFVEFSPEEMAAIQNDISWVHVRDIVSYRTGGSRNPGRALGEVLHVDTVNLCCYVRSIDEKENQQTITVPLHMMTGVEDRTKRQGTLIFAHAPETSSDLHRSRRELSIGHLILGMRWCHEYAFEEQQQGKSESPWVRMSAQVLSLLIAKEVSLHRENKTLQQVSVDEAKMFTYQLLDLFGSEEEFTSFSDPEYIGLMRREGRVNDLLPPRLLAAVRRNISDELEDAIKTILTIQESRKQAHHHHRNHYATATTALVDNRWQDQRA